MYDTPDKTITQQDTKIKGKLKQVAVIIMSGNYYCSCSMRSVVSDYA